MLNVILFLVRVKYASMWMNYLVNFCKAAFS